MENISNLVPQSEYNLNLSEQIELNKDNDIINQNKIASSYCFNTLVLSGGGSKGFASLGTLQYLLDKGYLDNVRNFIGTSIGAIINYLIIIGMKPDEIITYLCTHRITDKMKFFNLMAMINRQGALNFSILQEALEKITIEKVGYYLTLKDITSKYNKRFIAVTYNLTDDKAEYLSDETYPDMPVLIALRLTSNLPFIFEDFKYFGKYYVDGGIIDNFPIDYLDKDDNIIVGINLKADDKFKIEDNIAEHFLKIINVPLTKWTEEKIKKSSYRCKILEIEVKNIKITNFDVNNHDKLELFSQGYEIAKNYFEK